MAFRHHPAVDERLRRLAPDQRAAATAPPGPVLCVAPAGSGKTTTLVARVAWLVAGGVDAGTICVVAFNRRASEELEARLAAALEPLLADVEALRVRTFHALGREILLDSGVAVEPLIARDRLLQRLLPSATRAERTRLDLAISRLKLDAGVTATDVMADHAPGPLGEAFLAYEDAVARTGGVDFDDLVVRALRRLQADPAALARWRARCAVLLVDEAQDLDRSQLELALLLAAPANRIFLVGDDDQTIYGWRLADVRRVLGLAAALPGLRRVDLETNYRCPAPVVERAVRLVEHNRERFAKRIRPRSDASGRLVLAPDRDDDPVRIARVLRTWPPDGATQAVLARTNRELLPAVMVAIDLDRPFRAPRVPLLLDHPDLGRLLQAAAATPSTLPLLRRLATARDRLAGPWPDEAGPTMGAGALVEARAAVGAPEAGTALPDPGGDDDGSVPLEDLAAAVLGWAVPYASLESFSAAVHDRRARLERLRRDDAGLSLSTAHGTKGLEFDHVAVLMDGPRFPSARSLRDAEDPDRALEEERRLAYVAWTRARRSLTLVYDPGDPSRFLAEAFTAAELDAG